MRLFGIMRFSSSGGNSSTGVGCSFIFFARQLILIASFFRLLVLCTRSTLFCGHSLKYVWILECARTFCGDAYRIFLGFVCSGFAPHFLLPPCSYKSLADQRGQQLLPGLLLAGRSCLQAKVATYPPDVLSGHLCFCHERQHLGVQFLLGAISVFQHTQKVGPCRHPGEIPKNLPVPIACSRVAVSKEALNTNKCWRKAGKKTWFWEELQKPKRTPRVRGRWVACPPMECHV